MGVGSLMECVKDDNLADIGFANNTYSDICLTDIKPTLRGIRLTAWRLREEFLLKRTKYHVVAS